jgi:hypothetical protein
MPIGFSPNAARLLPRLILSSEFQATSTVLFYGTTTG